MSAIDLFFAVVGVGFFFATLAAIVFAVAVLIGEGIAGVCTLAYRGVMYLRGRFA